MGLAGLLMFEGQNQAILNLPATRGVVDNTSLRTAAESLGCEYAAELPVSLSAETVALVDAKIVHLHDLVPLSADARSISVAVADPSILQVAGDLAFALGKEVRFKLADQVQIRRLIRQHYGGGEFPVEETDARPIQERVGAESLTNADLEQLAGQPPVVRFVNRVLGQAIRDRASDVHFEPFEHNFKIRCRVDGALIELPPAPTNAVLAVVSRLKVIANLNIAERRLPQDGRIRLALEGRTVDLRISTLPTQFGESVVLRVLDQSAVKPSLSQIGLPHAIQAGILETIRRPNGILMVTGPTGSGKTTTLYGCLQELNRDDAKLLTVEDPVEYEIDGVMQVPVNPAAGLSFAHALRTFLRQDPDIVMVGEIRDLETAQIAIQASLTGHLVLTTLHTNDAPSAITRLVDMGLEPFLLASTLEGILAQRLVRRLCRVCREHFEPGEILLRELGVDPAMSEFRAVYLAKGCPVCHHTGYQGRLGIFEFLPMSDALRELVTAGAPLVEIRKKAMEQGMTTLREAGIAAILAGDTTIEEVLKYT